MADQLLLDQIRQTKIKCRFRTSSSSSCSDTPSFSSSSLGTSRGGSPQPSRSPPSPPSSKKSAVCSPRTTARPSTTSPSPSTRPATTSYRKSTPSATDWLLSSPAKLKIHLNARRTRRHRCSRRCRWCATPSGGQFRIPRKRWPSEGVQFYGEFAERYGARDLREEIEEKLKYSKLNLSEDLAKIETGVLQRLQLLVAGVNKKMEHVFQTLSSLFETINGLQLKQPEPGKPEQLQSEPGKPLAKDKLQQLLEFKLQPSGKDRPAWPEGKNATTQGREGVRKRSFMGFKY